MTDRPTERPNNRRTDGDIGKLHFQNGKYPTTALEYLKRVDQIRKSYK